MQTRSDTIAAIATAPGRGGIAVVRVSGPDAFAVAQALTGRAAVPGRIRFATFTAPDGAKLDEGVVLAFGGPHSYTGEDVVEFQCHGGTVTPRRVLAACLSSGARLARRGEFTERAFLNGKLGLEQAENVLNLIDAKTDRAADAALAGLAGESARKLRALYERALAISVELEHALDIDEGELPADFGTRIWHEIADLRETLEASVRQVREGKILREGALVVLAGPPNVGKSSLMNALLKENRAIVSDIPGTTRDSIEEWLDVDGWPVRLVDTAGLRETEDQIEGEGVKRAQDLMSRADVVLLLDSVDRVLRVDRVFSVKGDPNNSKDPKDPKDPITPKDPKDPITPKDPIIPKDPKDPKDPLVIPILTKSDLSARVPAGLAVSAKTGAGLEDLRRALGACLARRAQTADLGASDASDSVAPLLTAQSLLPGDASDDLVLLANRIRQTAEILGESLGATYSSDLLDRLFARFCVGK